MAVDIDNCNSDITDTTLNLAKSSIGSGHSQFTAGIRVSFDLTFSNKAWVELERYRFITFVSSQSTMHKITKFDLDKCYNEYVDKDIVEIMKRKVEYYNYLADQPEEFFCDGKTKTEVLQQRYLEILYSNPAGFELTARLSTNYMCLRNVYHQRKNHRLPEWREFCKWIESLPYAKEFILV
jgi:hypothetical protein